MGTTDEPTLLYTVKQVELAVRARLDELVQPHGLTTGQYTALSVLARHDRLTAAELARTAFVTPQSMSDLVGSLLRQGLVSRTRDPDNRRRLAITLTDAGRALAARLGEDARALEAEMLADLDGSEVDALRRALLACRARLAPARH